MLFFVVACVVPAFLVAVLATTAMRTLSPRWGLIDRPAARKVHVVPTPLGGGIGIWLGVVLPIAAAQIVAFVFVRNDELRNLLPAEIAQHLDGVLYRSGQMWAILIAGTILSAMGLIDDLKNLPWQPRLLLQACVAIGLVAGGVHATIFAPQPWIGYVVSVLWILVLVNSFNFLDNMDGLSSGIALIASLVLAVVMLTSTSEPHWLVAGVLLVLAGSLAGFLCHNWPPARIFMGDTGSYFIGLLMATMTILGTFYEIRSGSRHVILAPLCILAVPLYDFASVMIIRLSQGRSPFRPDKSHFSHRLVELGLKPRYAVMTVHLATLTTGLGGLLLYQVEGWSGAALVIALIVCVLAIVAILETVGRKAGSRLQVPGSRSDEGGLQPPSTEH
jgi:UDP-GlcNAc:undecaprenyl-phosphate GlcNAc-1-phosphate transferase